MRFSERIGKRSPRTDFQLESLDQELRNGLWNVIDLYIHDPLREETTQWIKYSSYKGMFDIIWFSFFKEPIDEMPDHKDGIIRTIRYRFYKWGYLEVYDFIDFLIQEIEDPPFNKINFINGVNFILERELSGYRIVNEQLVPITNSNEILEIENALNSTSTDKYKGAHIHLTEALNKLADRKSPDYRNSIKESISAIEAMCQIITNDSKAELSKTLKRLKEHIPIHGALEQGFLKIYGYTSDSDGIRHALLDESKLEKEDAQFMLISCSAFVNYLVVKASKAKC